MLKQKTSLSIGSAVVSGMLFLFAATAFAAERVTYHHFDALGSPVAATDEQGNVLWRETYQSYGERIRNEAAAADNTRWYTGHPQDPETGLVYAGARYYDPVIGRFMAIDPQPFLEHDPSTFNRYVYANNNPYRFVDPNGMWAEDIILGVPSLVVGAHSAWGNAKAGNWGALAVDIAGMLGDAAAIAAPGVPGGVGLGIRATREGAKAVAKGVTKGPTIGGGGTLDKLSPGEIRRIQNAANRSGKDIGVVGSRVNPNKAVRPDSDFDFVIDANSKTRNSLSRSLPGGKNTREGLPNNQDIIKGPIDANRPHVIFHPE